MPEETIQQAFYGRNWVRINYRLLLLRVLSMSVP